MGKTKCKEKKADTLKPDHKFQCAKCGRSAKKKSRLCKPQKIE